MGLGKYELFLIKYEHIISTWFDVGRYIINFFITIVSLYTSFVIINIHKPKYEVWLNHLIFKNVFLYHIFF